MSNRAHLTSRVRPQGLRLPCSCANARLHERKGIISLRVSPSAAALWMEGDLECVVYPLDASRHERNWIVHLSFTLLGSYSPTLAAAFSRNSDPSRMYLRRVASDRWPVWAMMARSGTPAAAAAVARPARSEWPA